MEKPWLAHYQDGVPAEINADAYNSIPELLEQCFEKFSASDAFHCMWKSLTYSDMDYLSRKFASYLQNNLGLKRGDRVAIMMPNILQYPVAMFGILRAGMV